MKWVPGVKMAAALLIAAAALRSGDFGWLQVLFALPLASSAVRFIVGTRHSCPTGRAWCLMDVLTGVALGFLLYAAWMGLMAAQVSTLSEVTPAIAVLPAAGGLVAYTLAALLDLAASNRKR